MSAPRTSIVITNYNYGRFVARCIDSALAQSYPNTEVVVVDDASRDNSREIIQSYGTRVLPILQDCNGGQGAAFNVGFRACHGDVVLFLDADDWLYPHAVARVIRAFFSRCRPGAVPFALGRLWWSSDRRASAPRGEVRRWGRRAHPPFAGSLRKHRDERKCVRAGDTVVHPACARKRVSDFGGRLPSYDRPLVRKGRIDR